MSEGSALLPMRRCKRGDRLPAGGNPPSEKWLSAGVAELQAITYLWRGVAADGEFLRLL